MASHTGTPAPTTGPEPRGHSLAPRIASVSTGSTAGPGDPPPRPEPQGNLPDRNTAPNQATDRPWWRPWRRQQRPAQMPPAQPAQPARHFAEQPLRPSLVVKIQEWAIHALFISFFILCAAVLIFSFTFVFWVPSWVRSYTADPPPPASEVGPDKNKGSWLSGLKTALAIIFRFSLLCFGGERLLRLGLSSLERLSGQWCGWSRRQAMQNAQTVASLKLWVGYAVMPLAFSAITVIVAGKPMCDRAYNIDGHLPVRTRDDIKAILNAWSTAAKSLFQYSLGIQQSRRWPIGPGPFVVFTLSTGASAAAQVALGLCKFHMLVWSFWFPVLGIFVGAWFVNHSPALLAARQPIDFGLEHWDFLLFLAILYLVRWSPAKAYCEHPDCW